MLVGELRRHHDLHSFGFKLHCRLDIRHLTSLYCVDPVHVTEGEVDGGSYSKLRCNVSFLLRAATPALGTSGLFLTLKFCSGSTATLFRFSVIEGLRGGDDGNDFLCKVIVHCDAAAPL
jgi:hypothetical protein